MSGQVLEKLAQVHPTILFNLLEKAYLAYLAELIHMHQMKLRFTIQSDLCHSSRNNLFLADKTASTLLSLQIQEFF